MSVCRDEVIGQGAETGGKPFALEGGISKQRAQGLQPRCFGLRGFSFPGIENGHPGMGPVEGAFSEEYLRARRMNAERRVACIQNRSPCAVCSQCVGLSAAAGEELAVYRNTGKLFLEPCLQVRLCGEPGVDPLPQDVVITGAFPSAGFGGSRMQDEVQDEKTPADLGRQLPW